jgi:hypothetical protein
MCEMHITWRNSFTCALFCDIEKKVFLLPFKIIHFISTGCQCAQYAKYASVIWPTCYFLEIERRYQIILSA